MPGFLGSGRNKSFPAVITVGKACLSLWGGGGSPRKLRFRRWFPTKAPQIMSQTQNVPCLLGALRQLGAMDCPFNQVTERGAPRQLHPFLSTYFCHIWGNNRTPSFLNEETSWRGRDISGVGGQKDTHPHGLAWSSPEQGVSSLCCSR